ncbi:PREDICTED: WAT1-related protein At4g30420-like [Populus euphratica]|uniref:WAT1-related protein n=1 Tax=Populus euphratica TaxID=75702 RepID=A0AAJ6XD42_POPEU|nr:PREDICTED: WAT1-related protein At4g30420-like [Populus euphratica]
MAMMGVQVLEAGVAIFSAAAFSRGLSPEILSVYRQATAALVIAPMAYFSRRRASSTISLGLKEFVLLYIAALLGPTINPIALFEGISLSSSTMSSTMSNLVPGLTFVFTAAIGLEKVNIRSLRSNAKIIGTVISVSGAMSMALLKGPKLLNEGIVATKSSSGSSGETWLLGSLILLGNSSCWAIWTIMQVPISARCPDPLLSTAWMCFFGSIQTTAVTIFLKTDPQAWKPHSNLETYDATMTKGIASASIIVLQARCIARRGPLFSAMFSPLCSVIVTTLAAIFQKEMVYTASRTLSPDPSLSRSDNSPALRSLSICTYVVAIGNLVPKLN